MPTESNPLPRWPLALAFASGAAGLAHQIVWTRRLVDLLGASADTFSKVVGAFFVGLSVGAWLASRGTRPGANFWRRVACAELAVGALALPVLLSFQFADWLWHSFAPGQFGKLAMTLLLVAPPAMAMGLVIPWMLRALARPGADGGFSVRLYAVNTLGGVFGLIATLLLTLPTFGLTTAGLIAVAVNVLVAIAASARAVIRTDNVAHTVLGETSDLPDGGMKNSLGIDPALLAFLSGFLVLAIEVVLQHQLAQVSINSLFSSGLVLVVVLLSLAAAAAIAPLLARVAGGARAGLSAALAATALLCAVQPWTLTSLRNGVEILPYELPPLPYVWEMLKLSSLAVAPMIFAAGFVFPLLLREATRGDARRAGGLLAWNGLGGWLGAEIAQASIAPAFGLWKSVIVVGLIYGATWMMIAKRRALAIPLAAVLMGAFFLAGDLPQATVAPSEKLHALRVGREGVVATLECGPGDWRMLFNNSYTLGGSRAQFNQERQALLPALLHGDARIIGTLGVATGSSVAGASLVPGVERVDAAELSPLVLGYAREFFGAYNRNVFADSRVHFLTDDARSMMANRVAAYDMVVGDLFLPWRTGEGRLFAREHFQNVRRALKPGGMFCQWLPLFQLTREQVEVIARTFREVFPDAFMVRGDFYSELPILGLVGGRTLQEIDWDKVAAACERLRVEGKSIDPLVRNVEGVAMAVLGPFPTLAGEPVNTLANSWLEWNAGKNILGLRTPWFVGIPAAEFMRELQRVGNPLMPERLRIAHQSGDFFLTLDVAATMNLPELAGLREQISERLPAAVRSDRGADWRQWPTRVKPELR